MKRVGVWELARESAARPFDGAERARFAHQRKPGTEAGAAGRAEQCPRMRIMRALHGWWFLPAIPDPARLTRRSLTPNSGQGDNRRVLRDTIQSCVAASAVA